MPRVAIVVSDLHMGAGRIAQGNTLEDFEVDELFAGLVQHLVDESQANQTEVELVFAGDTFEFWQVPALDDIAAYDPQARYAPDYYLGTTREESRQRMALIVSGHPQVFGALAAFLRPRGPRRSITFIKGNHDVQLHWATTQEVLRLAVGAVGERADCLVFEERRAIRDGLYVEHGNQYVERINRVDDLEEPHDPDHPDHLVMTPGGQVSIQVLNRLEHAHPWVDGVKPMNAMIWYLFRYDFGMAVRVLVLLLRYVPRLFWLALPLLREPNQDLEELKALEAELRDEEHLAALRQRNSECLAFYERVAHRMELCGIPEMHTLPDERRLVGDPLLARGLVEMHRQHARLAQVAQLKAAQEDACVVIFGHTHVPCVQVLAEDVTYINTGAWTWQLDMHDKPAETWRRLVRYGERYASQRRLTYARVDYTEEGTPIATLRELPRVTRPAPPWWRRILGRLARRFARR